MKRRKLVGNENSDKDSMMEVKILFKWLEIFEYLINRVRKRNIKIMSCRVASSVYNSKNILIYYLLFNFHVNFNIYYQY